MTEHEYKEHMKGSSAESHHAIPSKDLCGGYVWGLRILNHPPHEIYRSRFCTSAPPPLLRLFVFLPNSIKGIKNKAWLNLKGGCKYLCRFSGGSKEIGIKEMERAENEKRFVPFRGFKRIKGRENLTNYSSSLDTKVKVRHVKEHLAYSKITRSKIMKIWCFSSLQIVWLVSHKETEV